METRVNNLSEKVVLWLMRNRKTQIELAKELGITRQTLAKRIDDSYFTVGEIIKLKELGIE